MSKAVDLRILNEILDISRKILQPFPPLSITARKHILETSQVFETVPANLAKFYSSELKSFKLLLLEKHPIFRSERFLSVDKYNPLNLTLFNKNHKIPVNNPASDTHGDNYNYTRTNLRNGILFTYHDKETESFIPVTFNTNAPICLVAVPFHLNGDEAPIVERMITAFHEISVKHNIRNFPLIVKGLHKESVTSFAVNCESEAITIDEDVSTIPAEMNFPALSYDITKLKTMVQTAKGKGKHKKPKMISTVRKLNTIVYSEDWTFDQQEANLLARKWALSKIERLERRGMRGIDPIYLINTIVKSICERPPGRQNEDYFACAIRSRVNLDATGNGEILGVVVASRTNKTVAALNAVVVPVNKKIRDLGYYSVYKLAETMSQYGIKSYWHGPKELNSDVQAIIEFLGEPDKIEKRYCLKCYTGAGYETTNSALLHHSTVLH